MNFLILTCFACLHASSLGAEFCFHFFSTLINRSGIRYVRVLFLENLLKFQLEQRISFSILEQRKHILRKDFQNIYH